MVLSARPVVLGLVLTLAIVCRAAAQEDGKVYNGSFEQTAAGGHALVGWQAAGDKGVVQELAAERDPARGHVARLRCTRFVPGTPASHAMIAQFGHVAVRRGLWYRLSLWARAADLDAGTVQINLVNCRDWSSAGLAAHFRPGDSWQRFEFDFQAERDLKAADSRLAFYFLSTGTLWLDDVSLEQTTRPRSQWFPVVGQAPPCPTNATSGTGVPDLRANALPNSSFEAGEGWGCSAGRHYDWTANVFRRMGQWDDTQAFHGKRSWKVTLSASHPLMLYGGYTHLAAEVRTLELAHAGWVRVAPGQSYVFSVYAKSDHPDVPVQVSLQEPQDSRGSNRRTVRVGQAWQRLEVNYTPRGEFLRGCLSFERPEDDQGQTTLWIDAAQFERGTSASPYRPRAALEAGIETDAAGNLFTDPSRGLRFRLRAFNDSNSPQPLRGRLRVTDFWDRTVWEEHPQLEVAPGQPAQRPYAVLAGQRGFFRIHWEPEEGLAQSVRCAVIDPCDERDSVLGFNHAFGQDFLLPLAHQAGLRWWRDWSNQWDTVQPARDAPFDFHMPDLQIDRVLNLHGRMDVLLPYPGAGWTAAADSPVAAALRERRQKGELDAHTFRQALAAGKPARLDDFARYVAATVKHFRGRVDHYEILNEPLYTHYALPSNSYGYKYQIADYLDVLRTAYQAAKSADPNCTVIGGIATGPGSQWEEQFIARGGLRWCDVTNYHLYPGQRVESLEDAFQLRQEQMRGGGANRPIWVTEFGIYAEDDPVTLPAHAGDQTMDNAMRPDERSASADLVQWAAVMFAHGVRKIFYHAGVCQGLHDSSTGNMFFEYGGQPRKMYPAVAVLSRLITPDFEFIRKWDKPDWLRAYEFRCRGRRVVVLWTRQATPQKLDVPPGFTALDLMGNSLPGNQVTPEETPLYFVGK